MRTMLATSILAAALLLVACNTVSGAGKDVSSVGDATTKAADKAKN